MEHCGSSKKPDTFNILVLVSGNGTNLQALIDAEKSGNLGNKKIAAVLSDRDGVFALERADAAGIPAFVEKPDKTIFKSERRKEHSNRILAFCKKNQIGLVVLAGFLSILEGDIIKEYSGKMINLHPSLLPKFGGAGMYGERVHKAVLESGESESGCTIHFVDAGTDTGSILLQRKVPVLPGDTAESLAERIHKEEHIAMVEGVRMIK